MNTDIKAKDIYNKVMSRANKTLTARIKETLFYTETLSYYKDALAGYYPEMNCVVDEFRIDDKAMLPNTEFLSYYKEALTGYIEEMNCDMREMRLFFTQRLFKDQE